MNSEEPNRLRLGVDQVAVYLHQLLAPTRLIVEQVSRLIGRGWLPRRRLSGRLLAPRRVVRDCPATIASGPSIDDDVRDVPAQPARSRPVRPETALHPGAFTAGRPSLPIMTPPVREEKSRAARSQTRAFTRLHQITRHERSRMDANVSNPPPNHLQQRGARGFSFRPRRPRVRRPAQPNHAARVGGDRFPVALTRIVPSG
jgi:hypothetical protein